MQQQFNTLKHDLRYTKVYDVTQKQISVDTWNFHQMFVLIFPILNN